MPPLPDGGSLGLVERLILLRQQLPFTGARLQALATLAHASEEVEWPAGTIITREGEPATGALVILNGYVLESRGGVSHVLGAGSPIGHLETLAGIHHTATVETTVAVPGWKWRPVQPADHGRKLCPRRRAGCPNLDGQILRPVFGLGGSTDSKVLDQQSGFEATLSLMTSLLHGANIVHDVGFMDAGLQGSMQMIAICNEILGFLRATNAGVVVNDETLALDVIEELGPTGSYLGHDHTLRHFKEPYYSN